VLRAEEASQQTAYGASSRVAKITDDCAARSTARDAAHNRPSAGLDQGASPTPEGYAYLAANLDADKAQNRLPPRGEGGDAIAGRRRRDGGAERGLRSISQIVASIAAIIAVVVRVLWDIRGRRGIRGKSPYTVSECASGVD
jgi:hypothetical protein